MANVKDKEGWNPLHRACQQPPPKEKPRAQNNNEEGASNEEKLGTLSMKNLTLTRKTTFLLFYTACIIFNYYDFQIFVSRRTR